MRNTIRSAILFLPLSLGSAEGCYGTLNPRYRTADERRAEKDKAEVEKPAESKPEPKDDGKESR